MDHKNQDTWAILTCMQDLDPCATPEQEDEGLSETELGIAIGGGVAGALALVGAAAFIVRERRRMAGDERLLITRQSS